MTRTWRRHLGALVLVAGVAVGGAEPAAAADGSVSSTIIDTYNAATGDSSTMSCARGSYGGQDGTMCHVFTGGRWTGFIFFPD